MVDLILVHGVPGVGKSTLCRALAARDDTFFYADMAKDGRFGKAPMTKICADLYLQQGRYKSLLTEAVLQNRKARDRFVTKVIGHLAEHSVAVDHILIVHLKELDANVLASRRARTAGEYERMLNETQEGSELFRYVVYEADATERHDVRVRVERFRAVLQVEGIRLSTGV